MKIKRLSISKKAQTMIEYMLLLMVVVSLVLIGFQRYIPRVNQSSNMFFDEAARGILGEPPTCGDGYCCRFPSGNESDSTCPVDCPSGINACPP